MSVGFGFNFSRIGSRVSSSVARVLSALDALGGETSNVDFFNIADIGTLFTDVAGTIGVLGDGDLVRAIRCGLNGDLIGTQPVAGMEPVYRVGLDGLPYLDLPASAQIELPSGWATGPYSSVLAMEKTQLAAENAVRYGRFLASANDVQGDYIDSSGPTINGKHVRSGGTDVRPSFYADAVTPTGSRWVLTSEVELDYSTLRVDNEVVSSEANSGSAISGLPNAGHLFNDTATKFYGGFIMNQSSSIDVKLRAGIVAGQLAGLTLTYVNSIPANALSVGDDYTLLGGHPVVIG
jgi:hypothetical protein